MLHHYTKHRCNGIILSLIICLINLTVHHYIKHRCNEIVVKNCYSEESYTTSRHKAQT
ncbi:hypothetical protein E2C01_022959 [Portunus trituberculatus]|uniref:Uncharacterized protein n=1 Tax=Portunus trituberculatus TaxID=210409 RepID=A0A5B7E9X1_PORTR|nr:hypothetical protein [Portunus trituberculatus]